MSVLDTFNKLKYTDTIRLDDVNMNSIEVESEEIHFGENPIIYISYCEFKNGGLLDDAQIDTFIECNEDIMSELMDYYLNS